MKRVAKEYVMDELGTFTVGCCEAIKRWCEGTFMNIKVSWSNYAGNCTLIITSDYYDEELTEDELEKEIKTMFIHNALWNMRYVSKPE